MENPSQNVWLEIQDGDSSPKYLQLQSVGKREPDKLGYMKPWLKKFVYLFIKKLKVKLQQSLAAKLRAT